MDNKGQASAELILLIGGIFVVVLLVIFMYKNFVKPNIDDMALYETHKEQ